MLVQQMDNKRHLEGYANDSNQILLLDSSDDEQYQTRQLFGAGVGGCCGSTGALSDSIAKPGLFEGLTGWISCVWQSAWTCSQSTHSGGSGFGSLFSDQRVDTRSRAVRYFESATSLLWQLATFVLSALAYLYYRFTNLPTSLWAVNALWMSKWRSPIIQRLMQSVFIQLHYIYSLLMKNVDDNDNDDEGDFL